MSNKRFTPSQHKQAKETQVDWLGRPTRYRRFTVGDKVKLLRNFEHNGAKFAKDSVVTINSFPSMMYKQDVAYFHQTRYIAAHDDKGLTVTIVNFNEVRIVR